MSDSDDETIGINSEGAIEGNEEPISKEIKNTNASESKYYKNIERMLIALKLISRIRPSDRLSTRSDKIQIMRSGPFQTIRRLIAWEGRQENLIEIKELVENIKKLNPIPSSIISNINGVVSGLRSLQVTYQTDATTCAELDVIIEDLLKMRSE